MINTIVNFKSSILAPSQREVTIRYSASVGINSRVIVPYKVVPFINNICNFEYDGAGAFYTINAIHNFYYSIGGTPPQGSIITRKNNGD